MTKVAWLTDMRFHRCSADSSDSQDLVKLNKVIGGFADERLMDPCFV
jgi:hypothetical protein